MLLQFLKSTFRGGSSIRDDEAGYDRALKRLVDAGEFGEALALYDRIVGAGIRPCEPQFDAAYRRSLEATTTAPYALRRRSRFHLLYRLIEEILPLEGAIAECGCYRGLSSHLMLSRLRRADPGFSGAGYHVFDSFEGLSEPGPEDRQIGDDPPALRVHLAAQRGWFAVPLDVVRQGLAEFPDVSYHPGWIPASLSGQPERRYRFVHLDLDLHDPTLGALEYFFPRLVQGAILVCDDFNWPGERKAIEDFCARHGVAFETTPHNQAVLRRK